MKIQNGVTLVELMIVLAVLAIIVTVVVPGINSYLDTNKLRGAASQFFADVQYARSESIKRKNPISVSISSSGGIWCYGIDENTGCDCAITDVTDANACTLSISGTNILKVGSVSNFSGISMTSPVGANQTYATFDPIRGIASLTGTAIFQSTNGLETHVEVSVLGKVSACTPAGANRIVGYSTC